MLKQTILLNEKQKFQILGRGNCVYTTTYK